MAGTKRTRAMGNAAPVSAEYVSDDGFVASDSDAPASKKAKVTKKDKTAAKPAAKASDATDETFHELSTGKTPRRANVTEFKGKKLVNIREYYEKDGAMLPGKKVPDQANLTDLMKQLEMLRDALQGISLTTEQFGELLKALPDIKKALGYADGEEEGDEEKTKKPQVVKKEDKEHKPDFELTEKEKAMVHRERTHPGTIVVNYKDKIYFVDNHVHEQFHHWEGDMEAFMEEYEEDVVELDEDEDGPRELYEAIIDHEYDNMA